VVIAYYYTITGIVWFVMWFFRNPERNILDQVDNVAPVDGKVVMIKKVFEGEVLQQESLQISIFMSPLNVHVSGYRGGI
jgi:phosphatidylserine decarboxylase